MTIEKLTPRQRRCAELAARGIPNSQIAELMGVKPRTVKAHLARVFALLGIHDGHKRTKLAALLNQHRPVQPMPTALQIFPKAYSIAALVAQGLKNNEVARVLGTTEGVVKNYLRTLYEGSGMSNRTEFCGWWSAHHKPFLEGLTGLRCATTLTSAKRQRGRLHRSSI
jgi:DNA-binding NarL/FixJ family response regulator